MTPLRSLLCCWSRSVQCPSFTNLFSLIISARVPVGHVFGADEAGADEADPAAAAASAARGVPSRVGRGSGADAAGLRLRRGLGGRGEGGGQGRRGGHLGLPEEGDGELRPYEERRGSFVIH